MVTMSTVSLPMTWTELFAKQGRTTTTSKRTRRTLKDRVRRKEVKEMTSSQGTLLGWIKRTRKEVRDIGDMQERMEIDDQSIVVGPMLDQAPDEGPMMDWSNTEELRETSKRKKLTGHVSLRGVREIKEEDWYGNRMEQNKDIMYKSIYP